MKKIVVNLILWILFSIMQCGPVVGTLEYGEKGGPLDTLWLMVPFSLLCLGLVLVTTCYAVPRLLMRHKWGCYVALEFGGAYLLSLIEQLLVVYIWIKWDIMSVDHGIHWGWLLVNTLCNTLMLFFMLLAVGGWYLFDADLSDVKKEKSLADKIEHYMNAVKDILHPEMLSNGLQQIADKVATVPQEAEEDIATLATNLRDNLYNLPPSPELDIEAETARPNDSRINHFLLSNRYRAARIIIFQFTLIGICFGAFFATPDQPEFGARFSGFVILLGMFEIIAAMDIFVLFRIFRKKRRVGRYIFYSSVLAAVIILPILAERILLYLNHPDESNDLFILTTVLATTASILMIAFYIGGIGALLLYQDWLGHARRLVYLRASTKRLEYANLKKQINPHFLFNVLNNAGILTTLDSREAREMLLELRRLIDCQFDETERATISLIDTISFLRAYLALEATRRERFSFTIESLGNTDGINVPSLLFIPFVENAVKYASSQVNKDRVRIQFEVKERYLVFECENPVDDDAIYGLLSESGGLGVSNTLRRLELLYGDNFKYNAVRGEGLYRVVLKIPTYLGSSELLF